MQKNLKNMRVGSRNLLLINFLVFLFYVPILNSQEQIDLNVLQPTFEEEADTIEAVNTNENQIKSKKKKVSVEGKPTVNLRALDKITAKTKDFQIAIGKKKRFGYLEILPKKCNRFKDQNNDGVAAYIQVRDLSDKRDDKIFVFNGWTFSSSTTLKTFDHPVYDLWITGCENI
tara:strand:- start:156 stop:674 length:519 start_codon:yes stop_codon:yes gene_type:complete